MEKFYSLTNTSFDELGVVTHKDLWAKVTEQGYTALKTGVQAEFQKAEDASKYHFIFSTATEDRHGDVVMQNWELARYKKNPVVLDSHNYNSIEHIIGRIFSISVKEDKLQGDIEFATMNPRGALAQRMVEAEFLNATSVGFIPKEFDKDGKIMKSELLEVSMVSVPANHESLAEKEVKQVEDEAVEAPETPLEAPESVETPEAAPTLTPEEKSSIYANIMQEVDRSNQYLVAIAKELQTTTPLNLAERKRKIYQHLRQALQSQG